MNTYEAKIRNDLERRLSSVNFRISDSSSHLFSGLMKNYPILGSKIDWSKVHGTVRGDHNSNGVDFFLLMKERFSLSGMAIYAGDGVTDITVESGVDYMDKILSVVMDIPQHHYVIGENYRWCVCITMEGDFDFGFSRNNT